MGEYNVEAKAFRRALVSQRQARTKGGIYHLTQVELAYNSNRLEGSQLSEEQTLSLLDTQTIEGLVSARDIIETFNSFRALDWALDHVGEPITSETAKTLHTIVKAGTPESFDPQFNLGEWKTVANTVGGTETVPPTQVDERISQLLDEPPTRMFQQDLAWFHHEFQVTHPFADGNGRVGGLLTFKQALDNGLMPFIVPCESREAYYEGLRNYPTEPQRLVDVFRAAQTAYHDRYKDFVPPLR